jgi:hypothetical protein
MADEEIKEENQQPEKAPAEPAPIRHVSQSYQDDLARALNNTDAPVVQELLEQAHEIETYQETQTKKQRERKWYTATSLTLLIFALGVSAYALYHYLHLTVPVTQPLSVGVFPSTKAFVTRETDIRQVVAALKTDTDLKENTPYLVPLVTDESSLALISNKDFFSFLESNASEPFVGIFDSARLGVMNTGNDVVPFIVGSVENPITAAKEFLIAEPNLLTMLYRPLAIDLSLLPQEIGTTYTQNYRYNLPIRALSYTDANGTKKDVFFYGFATEHIMVVTTDPQVLKVISDTIIRQQ